MKGAAFHPLWVAPLLAALAACKPAPPPAAPPAPPEPPPAPVGTPAPAPPPDPMARIEPMTGYLREQIAGRRAARLADFVENNGLYEQIRAEFQQPDTLAAAWDWVTKACGVADPGPAPGRLAWDDRLARVVVAGRDVQEMTLALGDGVALDLHWIEPGAFWMGSLEQEEARKTDEAIHERVIPHGFWLGRFEVTQEQWQYLMATNPSHFQAAGPLAPVEQVSWIDAQWFLLRLNVLLQRDVARAPAFLFRLPTEAEWEYACRAGTRTATYAGDLRPRAANDCPELGVIAWYGGNAGVDYPGGWDSSKWTDLQIPHTQAGTHAVGLKQPNAWGLHDLLGNVWEWCDDRYQAYPGGTAAPGQEHCRVARGGSWGNRANGCRAAVRNPMPPEARHNRVGLRVAASWTP